MQVTSMKVKELFRTLVTEVGSEFDILLKIPLKNIAKVGGEKVAEGVQKVREGNIIIKPGYDGVFGIVHIWHETKEENSLENAQTTEEENKTQLGLEF
jgi:PHP family Zn ribbon phosphoesterase